MNKSTYQQHFSHVARFLLVVEEEDRGGVDLLRLPVEFCAYDEADQNAGRS